MQFHARSCLLLVAMATLSLPAFAQQPKPVIPHAQDKPPNDPRDPETAAKMMTVPEGFTVEVVAAEPDIVNPVAMAIDERGRFWITESLEYPRREPGPGKDRIKILEDTNGDGKMDKFTVFLEGLNIPSGIAVGHGGVWVANSPDILFVQDTDGDGKADKQEVIVTGFGRTDTHELPNSLTWGPDGWLYGLNGVFNHSHVKYAKTNPNYTADHKGWPLTCALFRIHPRTREFQVFCEGTSNPWGVAFNDEGDAFVSACVIDHLWHLVQTGYYHRQGGPYPPFTWKIESIVKHKHQKAAYCGIHYFDSDAYPEQYRRKLYMGNIHGGCINVDRIERNGATYKGLLEPDFLTANDAWFMPVVQKTGPDGSLYVLDWYDRYHCYQDANRDPAGIDRLKGRLYRVRYKETPRVPASFDLAKESDDQLVERLGAANDYIRWTATRLLHERESKGLMERMLKLAMTAKPGTAQQRHALYTLSSFHWEAHGPEFVAAFNVAQTLFKSSDPVTRAWAIRGVINQVQPAFVRSVRHDDVIADTVNNLLTPASEDASLPVRLQAIIALGKVYQNDYFNVASAMPMQMFTAMKGADDDPILSRVAWQGLSAGIGRQAASVHDSLKAGPYLKQRAVAELMPRVMDRLLVGPLDFPKNVGYRVAELFQVVKAESPATARQLLDAISTKVQSGELDRERLDAVKKHLAPELSSIFAADADSKLYLSAAFLATAFGDTAGFAASRKAVESASLTEDERLAALNSLIAAGQKDVLASVTKIFEQTPAASVDFRGRLLASLARLDDPGVGSFVLRAYAKLEPELQPRAIELLTQRAAWAKQLLAAVGARKIPATDININQARRLKELKDAELAKLLADHWGQVREGRDPNREQYIASMKAMIRKNPGDPLAGEKAFKKVCAQCHKIYGEGAEVGPDITRNGRNDFTQLLSNVFDPSLVIGAGYRSFTVVTNGGRVLNGLLVEDSPARIVLKVQGGKQEVIPRSDIDEFKVSEISLMPEQLEKQLSQQEIIDLFAYITLDKPPSDPSAKRLPGVSQVAARESTNPAEFASLVGEILPGFTTGESGERGVGLLAEHLGRDNVLRTHPISRDKPCVLSMQVTPPADKKTKLVLDVSHDPRGDWRLVVRGNGQRMADEMISKETCTNGWRTITVDLSKFAGQELKLDLVNQANDWSWEYGYWGGARIISD